jgi:hypothetical protein
VPWAVIAVRAVHGPFDGRGAELSKPGGVEAGIDEGLLRVLSQAREIVVMGDYPHLRGRRGEDYECHQREECAGTRSARHLDASLISLLWTRDTSFAESPLISHRQMGFGNPLKRLC